LKRHLEDLTSEAVGSAVSSWIGERVDWRPAARLLAEKTVPIHRHSWAYFLGGAAMFLFGLQVVSGCLLMLYYQPSETTAHESVQRIMTEVPYGWFVRSVHAWGATFFIAIVLLHFLSVLFLKAYRRPRELTWLSGAFMLLLALGFGFSGYLLPWNELSYYATLVGTKIPDAVPLVGGFFVHFLRGGDQVTGATLTRFFALHVAILPLILGGLLAFHLTLIQVQGMSLPLGMTQRQVRDRRPFFTEFLPLDACLWLVLMGAIATLAVLLPAEIGQKADVLKPAPEGIKPEWYFLFMFKTLKLIPEVLGVALFGLGAAFFILLPFLDRNAARERTSRGFTAIFILALIYAATFEILALLEPGVAQAAKPLKAATYSLSHSIVNLAILWTAIGFLLVYLRKLARENRIIRNLYPEPLDIPVH
jgi:quinol-cytochrome oxidoreductase complex cytochrome b subunit